MRNILYLKKIDVYNRESELHQQYLRAHGAFHLVNESDPDDDLF